MLKTVASQGEGIDKVVEDVDKHFAWAQESGELTRRRQRRAADEIEAIALAVLRARMADLGADDNVAELAAEVLAGVTDPYTAADRLIATLD